MCSLKPFWFLPCLFFLEIRFSSIRFLTGVPMDKTNRIVTDGIISKNWRFSAKAITIQLSKQISPFVIFYSLV